MKFSKHFCTCDRGEKNLHLPGESSSHSAFHHGERFSFTRASKFLFLEEALVSLNHFTQHSPAAVMRLLQWRAEQYKPFFFIFSNFQKEQEDQTNTYSTVSLTLTFMIFSHICPEDKVHYVNFKLSYKLKTWDRMFFMLIMKIKYPVWDHYNFGRGIHILEFLENPTYPWSVLSLQLPSTAFTEHVFPQDLNWYFGPVQHPRSAFSGELQFLVHNCNSIHWLVQ